MVGAVVLDRFPILKNLTSESWFWPLPPRCKWACSLAPSRMTNTTWKIRPMRSLCESDGTWKRSVKIEETEKARLRFPRVAFHWRTSVNQTMLGLFNVHSMYTELIFTCCVRCPTGAWWKPLWPGNPVMLCQTRSSIIFSWALRNRSVAFLAFILVVCMVLLFATHLISILLSKINHDIHVNFDIQTSSWACTQEKRKCHRLAPGST